MISLMVTISLVVAIYMVQRVDPIIAGLLAVIPIKIIGTGFMTFEHGGADGLRDAISGMLIGQFVWGFLLLAVYWGMRS